VSASATGTGVVSHAGAVLLLRTAEKTGLASALTTELAAYRQPLARHDPGKILLDLAVSLAIGGDCLADIAQLRAHPEIFGTVASDPTVSRLISVLAADADTALTAIGRARATARAHAWTAAGESAPDHDIDEQHPLVIDIDATEGHRPLREGIRCSDIQARLRIPSAVRVRRPRHRRHR